VPPPQPARIIQPVSAAVDLLHRAVTQLAEEDGWASFNGVAMLIRALAPDFDPKSYGCSKLSLLFAKTGQFEVRRDKKKQIFVRTLPFWANPPEADEGPHHAETLAWADQDELPF